MADETQKPVRVLIDAADPEKKPLLYACGTCGTCYSLKTLPQAESFARDCCAPKPKVACDMCAGEVEPHWTRCSSCRHQARLDAAIEVEDNGGPYFGFGDDRMYTDLDEAREDGHDWVCPCTEAYPRLCADSIFEGLTEDMFEDASVDDLKGTVEFTAAVNAFNEAQTTITYWADEKRKIKVPPYEESPA